MNESLPRIAIPEPTSTDEAYNQRSMPQYVRAIEAAGGVAVPILLKEPRAVQERLLASCSAILLPGSPADVDPARYGEPKAEACAEKDVLREEVDHLLLEDAFTNAKPFLGVCYGLQSLNVWRRGTLIQDLPHPEQTSDCAVNHQPGREVLVAHEITLAKDSRLAEIVADPGVRDLPVNSSHHQAVAHPGEGLKVVATSSLDGVIEAVEAEDPSRFVVAVQWHPERTYQDSSASRALFGAFVKAARDRSLKA